MLEFARLAESKSQHGVANAFSNLRLRELAARDGGESCKPEGLRAGSAQQLWRFVTHACFNDHPVGSEREPESRGTHGSCHGGSCILDDADLVDGEGERPARHCPDVGLEVNIDRGKPLACTSHNMLHKPAAVL